MERKISTRCRFAQEEGEFFPKVNYFASLPPLPCNENSGRIFTTFLRCQFLAVPSFTLGSYLVQRRRTFRRKGVKVSVESWAQKEAFLHLWNRGKRFLSCADRKEKRTRWCSMVNNPVYAIGRRWYSGRLCCEQIRVTLLGFLFSDRSRSSFPPPPPPVATGFTGVAEIFLYFSFCSILYFIPVFPNTCAGQFFFVGRLKRKMSLIYYGRL